MTLAKAAPPDWATWLANITGQPVEYVRHKLGMTSQDDRLLRSGVTADSKINGPHRNVASASGKGLATESRRTGD